MDECLVTPGVAATYSHTKIMPTSRVAPPPPSHTLEAVVNKCQFSTNSLVSNHFNLVGSIPDATAEVLHRGRRSRTWSEGNHSGEIFFTGLVFLESLLEIDSSRIIFFGMELHYPVLESLYNKFSDLIGD